MFTLIAAVIFSTAALLALGTIGWMFALYRDKMIAALQFQPMPDLPPVYELRIRRPRVFRDNGQARLSVQPRGLIAA
ncbi:MAG: hypothetical protein ABW039_01550 [Sphingobium sp.]